MKGERAARDDECLKWRVVLLPVFNAVRRKNARSAISLYRLFRSRQSIDS